MRLRRGSGTTEPSVPVRSNSPSVGRSAQLELGRRAIRVVGHLLTTGLSLRTSELSIRLRLTRDTALFWL
jgi:hypothetical protein